MKSGLQKSISSSNLSSSYSSSLDSSHAPKLPALPFPVFRDPNSTQSSNHASISSLTSDWSILGNSPTSDSNSNGNKSDSIGREIKKGSSQSTDSNISSSSSKSGGFDRFVKRIRSVSIGANKTSKKEKVLPLPPLPYNLGVLSKGVGALSNFDNSASSTPKDRKFNSIGTVGIPSNEDSFDHIPPLPCRKLVPNEEEDLASLLYLVHTAGDKFSSNGRLHDSPPSSPRYSAESRFKPESLSSPLKSQKSNTLPTASTRSYLSPHHSPLSSPPLNPKHLPTPPHSPLRTSTFPSFGDDYGVASEDEYSDSAEEPNVVEGKTKSTSTWLKTSNATFSKAAVDGALDGIKSPFKTSLYSPASVNTFLRGNKLGPVARGLLEVTVVKMESSDKILEGLQRPLSINLTGELNGRRNQQEIRVSLGRLLIKKKLRKGVNLLEGIELERSTKIDGSSRFLDSPNNNTLEIEEINTESTSNDFIIPFLSPTPTPNLDSPISPAGMSTSSSIRAWIARPSFIKRNLVTISVEGGLLIDLIRPSSKSQSAISYSNRIRCWSQTNLILRHVDKKPLLVGSTAEKEVLLQSRKAEKKQLLISERRGSLPSNGVPLSVRVNLKSPLILPSRSPSLLPVNAFELDNKHRINDDVEEDVPLAYLLQRSSNSVASTPKSPRLYLSQKDQISENQMSALRKAEEKSSQLEEEVMQMRYQEQLTKDRQNQIDLKREEEYRKERLDRAEEENSKREDRRLAEEKRRRRAMGLVDEQEGGLPRISRNNDGVKILYDTHRTSTSMSNQISGNTNDYSNNNGSANFLLSHSQVLPPLNYYGSHSWIDQNYQQYPTVPQQFYHPMMSPILLPPPQPFYAQSNFSFSRSTPDLQSYQSDTNTYKMQSYGDFARSPTSQYQPHRSPSPSPKLRVASEQSSLRRTFLANNQSANSKEYRADSAVLLRAPDTGSRRISSSTSRSQQLKTSPSSPNLGSQSIPRHTRTASGGVAFLKSAEQRLEYEKNRKIRLDEARKDEGKKETFLRL